MSDSMREVGENSDESVRARNERIRAARAAKQGAGKIDDSTVETGEQKGVRVLDSDRIALRLGSLEYVLSRDECLIIATALSEAWAIAEDKDGLDETIPLTSVARDQPADSPNREELTSALRELVKAVCKVQDWDGTRVGHAIDVAERLTASATSGGSDWQPPETAPRDGTQFLGDFGWPWPCPAVWNPVHEEWTICVLQAGDVDGKPDYYFETDSDRPRDLKRWMPLPELPKDGNQ